MTRLIAIVLFAMLAYLLLRYRTNAQFQKWIVIVLSGVLLAYISVFILSEVVR